MLSRSLRAQLSAAQGSTLRAVQRCLMPQSMLSYNPPPRHSASAQVPNLCNKSGLDIMDTSYLVRPGERSHVSVARIFARELSSLGQATQVALLMGYEHVGDAEGR
jgi:hypothetical protein